MGAGTPIAVWEYFKCVLPVGCEIGFPFPDASANEVPLVRHMVFDMSSLKLSDI